MYRHDRSVLASIPKSAIWLAGVFVGGKMETARLSLKLTSREGHIIVSRNFAYSVVMG